jgi:hypothetical protein
VATVVALVYARAGELDKAIDHLEVALSVPNFISIPWLRVDPLFDSLRDDPRFKALLASEPQHSL